MQAGLASPEGLVLGDALRPEPGPEEILVKVQAAGVNRADLNAAKGAGVATKEALGRPIGMEWAGEIIAVGSAVTDLRPGQMAACSGTGGYAQYAVCDQGRAIVFDPDVLPVEQAAALPLALMTAHNALVVGGMSAGDGVLVHGASSAVGLATLQIARGLGASAVIGTARDAARRAQLADHGCHVSLDPAPAEWWRDVLAATGGRGADVVVDMVTGRRLDETLRAAALLGRIVNVGRLDGTSAEIDLDYHALRRLSFIGVTFRSRTRDEVRDIVRKLVADVWPLVTAGQVRLPISSRVALADGPSAHAAMAANRHFGKIVLIPDVA